MPLRVLRSEVVVVPVGLAINLIVGGRRWEVGGRGERYQARTAMLAGEGEGDVFRCQNILVAAEVVGQCLGGDAGDADFEEEVGSCASPGGLVFYERGDGVEDRGGSS